MNAAYHYHCKFVISFLFCNIQNTGDSDKIWHGVLLINLLHYHVSVFHLTWIMHLHCIVKLKIIIGRLLPLSYWRKKPQNLSHLNCSGFQIRQWAKVDHVDTVAAIVSGVVDRYKANYGKCPISHCWGIFRKILDPTQKSFKSNQFFLVHNHICG